MSIAQKNRIRELENQLKTLEQHSASRATAYDNLSNHLRGSQLREKELTQKIEALTARTPANLHEVGDDPFEDYLNRERSQLALGNFTDDALANAVFMYGNGPYPHPKDILDGKAHSPIVYLTAAKERIRWLSRQVIALQEQLDDYTHVENN